MRRLVSAMAAALLATGLGVGTARAGGDVCVGGGHGCHRTLQAALDAARDGDTIRIAPGTYPGGATIDKSVRVHGAGAGRTIIRGGGPVLTIGGGRRTLRHGPRRRNPEHADTRRPLVAGLTLFDSLVTRNRLTASAGIDVKGGGLFSSAPLTLRRTLIAGNRPDQCVGC
jgi:hypothetical protein